MKAAAEAEQQDDGELVSVVSQGSRQDRNY